MRRDALSSFFILYLFRPFSFEQPKEKETKKKGYCLHLAGYRLASTVKAQKLATLKQSALLHTVSVASASRLLDEDGGAAYTIGSGDSPSSPPSPPGRMGSGDSPLPSPPPEVEPPPPLLVCDCPAS